MNWTALIPLPYRPLALALLAVALLGFGWVKGVNHVQGEWDAAFSKQAMQVATVKVKQAEATVQVLTKYIDRVQIRRVAGQTIIKKVPVYVPAEADAACVLSRGFVRLHDAAAAGHIPEPAGGTDASPAGIALSSVARTVADNYERCNENAEQLIALHAWIRQMQIEAQPSMEYGEEIATK
jgi:hypothetical protein